MDGAELDKSPAAKTGPAAKVDPVAASIMPPALTEHTVAEDDRTTVKNVGIYNCILNINFLQWTF